MGTSASELKEIPVPQDLKGHYFYPPGVVATYCVLSLPVGLCLYGLNVARRGSRVMGYVLAVVAGVTSLWMLAAAAMDAVTTRTSGLFGLLGVVVGLGFLKTEGGPYRAALARGGVTARWWPPLLWVIGSMLVVVIVVAIFGPEEVFR